MSLNLYLLDCFLKTLIWMSQFWQERWGQWHMFFSGSYTRRHLMSECVIIVDIYLNYWVKAGPSLPSPLHLSPIEVSFFSLCNYSISSGEILWDCKDLFTQQSSLDSLNILICINYSIMVAGLFSNFYPCYFGHPSTMNKSFPISPSLFICWFHF